MLKLYIIHSGLFGYFTRFLIIKMNRVFIYNDIEIKDVTKSSCGRFNYNYDESRKQYNLLHSEYLYFANVAIGMDHLNLELKEHIHSIQILLS